MHADSDITTGIAIPAESTLLPGLRIHHFGGIIVHSKAVVEEGRIRYHGVTVGGLGGWGSTRWVSRPR